MGLMGHLNILSGLLASTFFVFLLLALLEVVEYWCRFLFYHGVFILLFLMPSFAKGTGTFRVGRFGVKVDFSGFFS